MVSGCGRRRGCRLFVCSIERERFSVRRPREELIVPTLKERVLLAVHENPGLTDRELAADLRGPLAPPQSVNQTARALVAQGRLSRTRRKDGKLGNFLPDDAPGADP